MGSLQSNTATFQEKLCKAFCLEVGKQKHMETQHLRTLSSGKAEGTLKAPTAKLSNAPKWGKRNRMCNLHHELSEVILTAEKKKVLKHPKRDASSVLCSGVQAPRITGDQHIQFN